MMGNEDHRIDDNKGYDTIRMELDVDGDTLTMVRKLGETKIQVFSNVVLKNAWSVFVQKSVRKFLNALK